MKTAIFKGWRQYGYYQWLLNHVESPIAETHTMLLDTLHNIEFTWKLPMDANRAADGINLRYIYIELEGVDELYDDEYFSEHGYKCSVLEMLIALTTRFATDVVGESFMSPANYFWILMENVDLIKYTDAHFDEEAVRDAIFDFLDNGGLFPLNGPSKNGKDTELWYQMCEWFREKYWQNGWF